MSVVRDNDISPSSEIAVRRFEFQKELTPISQAGVAFGRYTPGVKFEILSVTAWARTANAAARVDVRVSGVTALGATFAPGIGVGNAPAAGAVLATNARFGLATDTIDIYLTTDAGAVMDDVLVTVRWRARVYRSSP